MSVHIDDDDNNQLALPDEDQDINVESCDLITTHFRKSLEQITKKLQQE